MDKSLTCCAHPECEATEIALRLGPLKEPFCVDHIDYGIGRAFGPLHRILDAAQKAGIGEQAQKGGSDDES